MTWPGFTPLRAPRASRPWWATQNDLDIWARSAASGHCGLRRHPRGLYPVSYGYGLFTGGLGLHDGAEDGRHSHPLSPPATPAARCRFCRITAPTSWPAPQLCHVHRRDGAGKGIDPRACGCASASLAPSPGPRKCAGRLKRPWPSAPSTSTAFGDCGPRRPPASAREQAACTSKRTSSTRRSSTPSRRTAV